MANNGTVYDDEVKGTLAAKLVPKFLSQGGGYQLMYKIQFNDGRSESRPLSECSCPLAIAEYERL
ncbi:hypothetical protein AAVH_21099 [Aphelenchoides avenae]|nr:hypothetical protein AAVH_21099 [Aphelenchus avenae]